MLRFLPSPLILRYAAATRRARFVSVRPHGASGSKPRRRSDLFCVNGTSICTTSSSSYESTANSMVLEPAKALSTRSSTILAPRSNRLRSAPGESGSPMLKERSTRTAMLSSGSGCL